VVGCVRPAEVETEPDPRGQRLQSNGIQTI
jgi:hypothetical protein